MADLQRLAADALIQALRGRNCCAYDFFRAVRLLQAARSDLPPIGTSKTPDDDPVRFCQRPSLSFASSALAELVVDPDQPANAPRLYVNFMGMFGPNGPLPLHLTHYVIQRQLGQDGALNPAPISGPMRGAGHKDHSFADFVDIFQHRMVSLFFRAWSASQPTVELDRPGRQRFLFFLGALTGESNASPEDQIQGDDHGIPLAAKVFYAGRLASPARNAEGLEGILSDFFQVPVRVTEFVGRWFDLPAEDVCQLGISKSAGQLGRNLIIGSKTWATNLVFRIRMGPLGLKAYSNFLPGGKGFRLLQGWIVNYCGTELLWDLQLILRAAEVPAAQLGRAGKLGWTTWLKSKPGLRDADDLIIVPPPE